MVSKIELSDRKNTSTFILLIQKVMCYVVCAIKLIKYRLGICHRAITLSVIQIHWLA